MLKEIVIFINYYFNILILIEDNKTNLKEIKYKCKRENNNYMYNENSTHLIIVDQMKN